MVLPHLSPSAASSTQVGRLNDSHAALWLQNLRDGLVDINPEAVDGIMLNLQAYQDGRLSGAEALCNLKQLLLTASNSPWSETVFNELARLMPRNTFSRHPNAAAVAILIDNFKSRQPQAFQSFLQFVKDWKEGRLSDESFVQKIMDSVPDDSELLEQLRFLFGSLLPPFSTSEHTSVKATTVPSSSDSPKGASNPQLDQIFRQSEDGGSSQGGRAWSKSDNPMHLSESENESKFNSPSQPPPRALEPKNLLLSDMLTKKIEDGKNNQFEEERCQLSSPEPPLTPIESNLAESQIHALVVDKLTQALPGLLPKNCEKAINLFRRIASEMLSVEHFERFGNLLSLYMRGCLSLAEFLAVVEGVFPMHVPNLPFELKQFLLSREPARRRHNPFAIPLSELDFTGCTREGMSYLHLPENYMKLWCGGRESADSEIVKQLNDDLVSIPHGSEDDSFRHLRRNPYEENMFRIEDEMLELDCLIKGTEAIITLLEPLEKEINSLNLQQRFTFTLKEPLFNVRHLKSICRIYGDHGSEVIEILRRSAGLMIQPLMERLRIKMKEWVSVRHYLCDTTWKEVSVKNFYKQFEHQLLYLKPLDRISMMPPIMIHQALMMSCLQRGVPFPIEIHKKARNCLKQLIHLCTGFPGCPTLTKENENNKELLTNSHKTPNELEQQQGDHQNHPIGGINSEMNKNYVDQVMATLNVHVDSPFGYADDLDSYRLDHSHSSQHLPIIEYSEIVDQEILYQSLQLLNQFSKKCQTLSHNQMIISNRVQRLLNIMIMILFFSHDSLPISLLGDRIMKDLELVDPLIGDESSSDSVHQSTELDNQVVVSDGSPTKPFLSDLIQSLTAGGNNSRPSNNTQSKKNLTFVSKVIKKKIQFPMILCANDEIFIYLRFYCTLYERLWKLKQIMKKRGDPNDPSSKLKWMYDDNPNDRLTYSDFFKLHVTQIGTPKFNQETFEDVVRVSAGNDGAFIGCLPILAQCIAKSSSFLFSEEAFQFASLFICHSNQHPCAVDEYKFLAKLLSQQKSNYFEIHFSPSFGHLSIYIDTPEETSSCLSATIMNQKKIECNTAKCKMCQSNLKFELRAPALQTSLKLYHTEPSNHMRMAFNSHGIEGSNQKKFADNNVKDQETATATFNEQLNNYIDDTNKMTSAEELNNTNAITSSQQSSKAQTRSQKSNKRIKHEEISVLSDPPSSNDRQIHPAKRKRDQNICT